MKVQNLKLVIKHIQFQKVNFLSSEIIDGKILLMFDNNLSFEFSDFKDKKFNKIFIINSNESKEILTK